jgi:PHD/YefM family antitoxin component YafN of YafNO toxin-antitoxin module
MLTDMEKLVPGEKLISVATLARNAVRIAKEIKAEGTIYRIKQPGRGNMVLVDAQYFDGWVAALDEMSRPGWREVWDETTRDIAANRGKDLDVVMKELGLGRSPHPTRSKPARRAGSARRKKVR